MSERKLDRVTDFLMIMVIVAIMLGVVNCTSAPKVDHPIPVPAFTYPALSWEKNHPERKSWSEYVFSKIQANITDLEQAEDLGLICSNYQSLSKDQRVSVLSELISATAYYESAWNVKSASVDVGIDGDLDTYSVGLLQMSVIDQQSYKLPLGYKYADLLEAKPNLDLGIQILAKQAVKYRKIFLVSPQKGVYWAVLYRGGKYDQSEKIISMVKKLEFCK